MVNVRVVAVGVDSLYLAYRGQVPSRLVRELERRKAQAVAAQRRTSSAPVGVEDGEEEAPSIELGPLRFEVRPHGSQQAPYLFTHDDASAALSPETNTTLQIRLSSRMLWREGVRRAVELADAIARDVMPSGWLERWVQRLDIAVDHQGYAPTISALELFSAPGGLTKHPFQGDEVVEETLLPADFWLRWHLTGFRFGRGGPVVVRWYDKTTEIGVSRKGWFLEVWRRAPELDEETRTGGYVEGETVWRLEVQLRREFFKGTRNSLGERVDASVETVLDALGECWRHVTMRRLRLTLGDAERLDRATSNEEWLALAQTPELDGLIREEGRVSQHAQLSAEARGLVPAIRGYLASYAALTGKKFDDGALDALTDVATYTSERGEDLEKLVQKQRERRRKAAEREQELDAKARAARARRKAASMESTSC